MASPPSKRLKTSSTSIYREKRKAKAHLLTEDNVMRKLDKLPWEDVGNFLVIPKAKIDEISSKFDNRKDRLRQAVSYWLLNDPYASWRRLKIRLHHRRDGLEKSLSYTEDIRDDTLTKQYVCAAVETVSVAKDAKSFPYGEDVKLEYCLDLPISVARKLREQYSNNDEYKEKLVEFWLETSPYASWDCLARKLRYYGQEKALEKVKDHVKIKEDPPTLGNITEVFSNADTNGILLFLNIPSSIINDINKDHSSMSARKQAYWDWYLNNLFPSWKNVADALYRSMQHQALNEVRNYYKGSSESERLFDEAMKVGFVDSKDTKIVVYGAPGVGKTSLVEFLIGNDVPQLRKSTPLARHVSMFQVDVNKQKWVKLPLEEKKQVLVQAIVHARTNLYKKDDDSEDESDSEENDLSDEEADIATTTEIDPTKMSSTGDIQPRQHSATDSTAIKSSGKKKMPQQSAISNQSDRTCDELTELVGKNLDKPVSSLHKIRFIDSGGQPQFREILPIFLRRMGLYIFVFKLSEELAAPTMVEYYDEEGKSTGKPYPSYSSELILKQCLYILSSHRLSTENSGSLSKFMVVGTHRKEEEKCTTETIKDKNEKLKDILDSYEENMLSYGDHDDYIFPIDTVYREEQDKEVAEIIQDSILKYCSAEPTEVPLQYHVLEIMLEEASQSRSRKYLSRQECLEAAHKVHLREHELDAALEFLNEISAVFYFPDILREVIFTSSQFLLNMASLLVRAFHKNVGSKDNAWKRFKNYGIFNVKFIDRQEEFQKFFKKGLFTSAHLIELFKELLIIFEFGDADYIMPALLSHKEDLSKYRTSKFPAALSLGLPERRPCLGIFCSLICYLVSNKWEILTQQRSNTPVCLFRNCVQFSLRKLCLHGVVTLIDADTHFEACYSTADDAVAMSEDDNSTADGAVAVSEDNNSTADGAVAMSEDDKKYYRKVCPLILRTIKKGLSKAFLAQGYNNYEPPQDVEYVCSCADAKPHHTLSLNSIGHWTCEYKKSVELEEKHLVWQEKEENEKDSDKTFKEFTLINIKKALKDDLSCRDHLDLALELGLSKTTVERHERDWPRDSNRVLTEIIQEWLNGADKASWNTLSKALKDINPDLATKISYYYPSNN